MASYSDWNEAIAKFLIEGVSSGETIYLGLGACLKSRGVHYGETLLEESSSLSEKQCSKRKSSLANSILPITVLMEPYSHHRDYMVALFVSKI